MSLHPDLYRMACPGCRTLGPETPSPDRAENAAQDHNRLRHDRRAVADVETWDPERGWRLVVS